MKNSNKNKTKRIRKNTNKTKKQKGNKIKIKGKNKTKRISVPKRYLPDVLTEYDKQKYKSELNMSRDKYKNGKYYTRKKLRSFKSKKSNHIKNAMKLYNVKKIRPSKELSKKTQCSLSSLQKIHEKGQGAYYSSGSRPNQTAHSWGYARLASAITGGPSSVIDNHLLEEGCKHTSKALLLSRKNKKINKNKIKQTKRLMMRVNK